MDPENMIYDTGKELKYFHSLTDFSFQSTGYLLMRISLVGLELGDENSSVLKCF